MRDQAIGKHRRPRKKVVKAASPERAGRPRRRALRWVPRVLSLLAYLVVLISGGWLLYYSVESPYFQISDISVSGAKLLNAGEVQDTAGVLGGNAVLVRTQSLEQSIERLSAVQEARAEVTLGGKVTIDVVERTPLVQWIGREGSFLVDKEGVVFGRQQPSGPIPVVRDLDGPTLEVGNRVDPAVLTSVALLDTALPARAGFKPAQYDFSRGDGISVLVSDGPRVLFGDASDLDGKLTALAAVREHLEASKYRAESIDLRFRGRPTYVLAPSAPVKQTQSRQ